MYLKTLLIKDFRNYNEQRIDFSKNINLIYGNNAQGKTNILEAIYLCAFGKSFRTNKDKELINFNKDYSIIELTFDKNNFEQKIKIIISKNKVIYINRIKILKLSELLSKLNIVLFSPDDIEIITSSPQKRRKYLNILISQLKPNYVYLLNSYIKTIEMRNTYLKQSSINKKLDDSILNIYDEKVAEYSAQIYKYRKFYVDKLNFYANQEHYKLTKNKENLKITLISQCEDKDKILTLLKNNRSYDLKRCQTSVGIHRDDIDFSINNNQAKIYGSQGQKRSIILSLKMAELNIINEEVGELPILLLDDFMSELDYSRINNFTNKFSNSQVIMTCTDKLKVENKKINLYNVKNGHLKIEK